MLPIIEKNDCEIGPHAVVACPLVNFQPRRAAKSCPPCEYFDGLAVMGVAIESEPWSKFYAIRCNHTIERRTQHIEVMEA